MKSSHGLTLRGQYILESPNAMSVFRNGITAPAINDLFQQYFLAGVGLTWYMGLIDAVGFTAVDDDLDTMASHVGWEEIIDYSEGTRPAWDPDAPSGKAISNSAKRLFTLTSAVDIKGIFLTSDPAKGGNTGILFNTGVSDIIHSVQPQQQAKVIYSLQGQEGVN
jgi:hypothetical protein